MWSQREKTFCAFCGSSNHVYKKKHLGPLDLFGCIIFAMLLGWLFKKAFDIRITLIAVVFLILGETFARLRWRTSVVCKSCGFDPAIYKKSPALAAERVKAFMEMRKNTPEYWLKPPPQLPVRLVSPKDERGAAVDPMIER